MRLYRVRGHEAAPEFVQILAETPAGFDVMIRKGFESSVKEYRDFISRALFEACLRTQYLIEEEETIHIPA